MAITYPLALPTAKGPRSARFAGQASVGVSASPFTGEQQVVVHQGQWWSAELRLPPMVRADAEDWSAFLFKLNGREGTFLMGDPAGATPRGAAAATPGTPIVQGGGQTSNTLQFNGVPINTTDYLLRGDYIQLGTGATTRLYKVLDDASSDGIGTVLATIWPKLRTATVNNETVVVSGALGRWRALDNEMARDVNEMKHFGLSLTAVEAL